MEGTGEISSASGDMIGLYLHEKDDYTPPASAWYLGQHKDKTWCVCVYISQCLIPPSAVPTRALSGPTNETGYAHPVRERERAIGEISDLLHQRVLHTSITL